MMDFSGRTGIRRFMRDDRWTLLLREETEETEDPRQITLPFRSPRLLAVGVGFACLGVVVLLAFIGIRGADTVQNLLLERQNQVLSAELDSLRERLGGLQGELADLAERDAELRVLAGLETIDEEIQRVGVGGPGTPQLETHPLYELDPAQGEEAFAAAYDLNALERRARLLRESLTEAGDSLQAHHDLLKATPSILPTDGRISSGFALARLHPIHHEERPHTGVDISAPRGTPILAAARGRVTVAARRVGYGLMVELDHGYGYSTLYGHASELLVRPAQRVERGDMIARVGSSGTATSPHLHYEVHVGSRAVNPRNFIIMGAVP